MEPEELCAAQQERFTQLMLRLQPHLLNYNSRLALDQEYSEVNNEWMLRYAHGANNQSIKEAGGITRSDWLYVLRAYILVARTGRPAPQARLEHAAQVLHLLQVWSLNHVHGLPEGTHWPTSGMLDFIDITAAEIVVYYLSAAEPHKEDAALAPLAERHRLIQERVLALATTRRWNESEEAFKKRGQVDYGVYWKMTDTDKLRDFVACASRILRHIYLHKHYLAASPHFQLHQSPVERAHRGRFAAWLQAKCQLQLTDGFIIFYRATAYEMWLTLGARLIESRNPLANREDPMTCVETTLGVDTAGYLQSLLETPMASVAADAMHPMHEILVLLMFHYMLKHYTQGAFSFIGDEEAPTLIMHYDVDRLAVELTLEKRFVILDRRPLIVQLQKQYYIHNVVPKARWVPCADATDAILLWMYMVKNHYDGKVGNDVDINGFIDQFF